MSGICGWTAFHGDIPARSVLESMAARLARFGGGEVHREYGDAAAIAATAPNRGALAYRNGSALAVIHGCPRVAAPGLAARATAIGLPAALIEAFRARGSEFLASLRGRFSLALILEQERRALLAVDRVSICPLSYSQVPGGIVFATDPAVINMHPQVSLELDSQQIYNYLYFHMIPGPSSIFRTQHRIAPGGYVLADETGVTTGSYWELSYTREAEKLSVADLKDEFRGILRASVQQELENGTIGSFLSGGTDSSTVAGVVGELTGQAACTYSIGFDAEGYDESYYARLASRHFRTSHREYRVTPADVVDAIPLIAEVHAEPFGNSSAVPTYYCARLARADGVTHMLAGDGGDELFGGNSRYATQYLFSLYSDLPRVLRHGFIEPLVLSVPSGDRVPLLRKLRSYIRQASTPMPARLETYNLLERLGPENIFAPDFLASVRPDRPLEMLTDVYTGARAGTLLNRMLAMDFKFTLADNDLPKVNRSVDLAGIDVGYPLLSDEMIDFAERLPVRLKLRGTQLRYFYKEALRDFLPLEIIAKKKHGFGLPFGPWLNGEAKLRALAVDALDGVKRRGLVRNDFVDRLMNEHLPSHPGFYGTMVWLLMMLEFWYRHHVDARY